MCISLSSYYVVIIVIIMLIVTEKGWKGKGREEAGDV